MNRRPSTCSTTTRWPRAVRDLGDAAAGRAGGEVERADDARLAVDVADQLALVPDMVAHGDDVGTGGQELVGDGGGEPVAAGGVLAVDDDRIELERRRAARAARPAGSARPERPTTSPTIEDAHGAADSGAVR